MNNPKNRQHWILEELKKTPLISYADMFGKYSVKFGKSDKTFDKDWKQAKDNHTEYQKKVEQAKEQATIRQEVEQAKKGLLTKFERLMNLQKLVDDCLRDLTEGLTNDVAIINGSPQPYRRKMSISEHNQTRRTLKELQAEISKIEGDYASDKISVFVEQPLFND